MTLERRTPLKRSPMKRTGAQLQRAAFKRKAKGIRATALDFSDEVKAQVRLRAGGRCEFPGCGGPIEHFHHRLLRKHGGPGTVLNCMGVCRISHRYIHDHPSESYANGWLIHSEGADGRRVRQDQGPRPPDG